MTPEERMKDAADRARAVLANRRLWCELGKPGDMNMVLDALGLVWRDDECAAVAPDLYAEAEH